jgi:hypothetical protein
MATQYTTMSIEGDPTIWALKDPITDPDEIAGSSVPLALNVISPLNGILLLSVQAAAFVTLFPQSGNPPNPMPMGWIPGDLQQPSPFLYLPSVSTPASHPVCYQMPAATTLAAVQGKIATAMNDAATTTLSFEVADTVGYVVINGAALPFAVIGPPSVSAAPEG